MSESTPIDRWGIIKNWLEDNQRTIVFVVGMILLLIISFGLGRLSVMPVSKKPIIIEVPSIEGQAANTGQVLQKSTGETEMKTEEGKGSAGSAETADKNKNQSTSSGKKGIIVASKKGEKYHWPWCAWAEKIKPENQVWFNSEAEAQKAGYQPCSAFQKLSPAGYRP